jgi:large subunit ribosomal protein L23
VRMDSRQIVKRALISEKGSILRERANQFTFEVHTDANKIEIKRAVESIFKVKVENVRTQMMHGKVKRLGRSMGRRPDWKRAVVTLAKDQTIELFDQV